MIQYAMLKALLAGAAILILFGVLEKECSELKKNEGLTFTVIGIIAGLIFRAEGIALVIGSCILYKKLKNENSD